MSALTLLVARVERGGTGTRLDRFVASLLEQYGHVDVSKSAIRRLIVSGGVCVNGQAIRRPAFTLAARSRIEARVDPARLAGAGRYSRRLTSADILYLDDDLIAVAKPPGLQTHPGADPTRSSLVSVVSAWLAAQRPGVTPYLGVHQRLDRDTSGVVVFALSARANPGLATAFSQRHVKKTYHALCAAPDRAHGADVPRQLRDRLSPAGTGRSTRMVPARSGVLAETTVRIAERLGPVVLVEAVPTTGRRHQVRAQLAADGLPILGDIRYGEGGTWPCPVPRVLLHAYSIDLPHPTSGIPLSIVCPWPEDFKKTVDCFRGGQGTERARTGPRRVRRRRIR